MQGKPDLSSSNRFSTLRSQLSIFSGAGKGMRTVSCSSHIWRASDAATCAGGVLDSGLLQRQLQVVSHAQIPGRKKTKSKRVSERRPQEPAASVVGRWCALLPSHSKARSEPSLKATLHRFSDGFSSLGASPADVAVCAVDPKRLTQLMHQRVHLLA
eukprot:1993167-Rhodomonas_salina.3